MTEQIGERLTELDEGDSIVVTVGDDQYSGDITETKRWMCELIGGFIESGSISIYLNLSPATIERHSPVTDQLVITATEDVPQSWDDPRALYYDPVENETVARIGGVNEVREVDGSLDPR